MKWIIFVFLLFIAVGVKAQTATPTDSQTPTITQTATITKTATKTRTVTPVATGTRTFGPTHTPGVSKASSSHVTALELTKIDGIMPTPVELDRCVLFMQNLGEGSSTTFQMVCHGETPLAVAP